MKTFAAVLFALLATGGIALAHGTGGGGTAAGGPVMSPVSMPVFSPIMPIGVGSSPQGGFPVFTPERPAPLATEDTHRHHKPPVVSQEMGPFFVWDPRICRPPQWLFTPDGAVELADGYSCGLSGITDAFAPAAYGLRPVWLPAAFLW